MTTTHIDDTRGLDVGAAAPVRIPYENRWRFSWGAVFAGTMVAIGTWILLHLLGMGIGLTVIDPEDVQSLRGSGMTTGVWSLIAPIVAMFVGGLAAARVAGPMPPLGAVIHGAVVWSLATVASTVLVVALVASIVGRVASAELTREAGAMTGAMNQNAGVTTDLPGRDNDQVRERTGAMRRNEARRNQAQGTELRAAEATGKGLLGLFVAMLLGLLAALGGAIFGDARERRLLTRTT